MHLWSFGVPHTVLAERSVLPHLPPGGLLCLTLSPGLVVTRLETCQSDDDTTVSTSLTYTLPLVGVACVCSLSPLKTWTLQSFQDHRGVKHFPGI